jgi:hypothetical protein
VWEREPTDQVAGFIDLLELRRLDPRICDEHRGELEAEQPPDRER